MSQHQATPPQWWLLEDGAPSGPFPHAHIEQRLATGQLSPESLASPVGTTQWRTLREWNCFSGHRAAGRSPETTHGPQEIDTSSPRYRDLPEMAQWLIYYGLFVSPVLWLINQASCVAGTPIFADSSSLQGAEVLLALLSALISLGAMGLLFAGALYLRKRMRAGCRLLIAGLSLDLAGFVVGLFLFAFLMAAAAQDAGGQHLNPDDSPLGLGGVAVCAISIASGIFELVGLVWLLSMGRDLPLR